MGNVEEETHNHHAGECVFYQKLRKKIFGKNTANSVVNKLILSKLATDLQQAGKLAEYGQ